MSCCRSAGCGSVHGRGRKQGGEDGTCSSAHRKGELYVRWTHYYVMRRIWHVTGLFPTWYLMPCAQALIPKKKKHNTNPFARMREMLTPALVCVRAHTHMHTHTHTCLGAPTARVAMTHSHVRHDSFMCMT